MKIIDLLNKIANGEMDEEAIFYVNGDFFYDLTVIGKELYVINTMSKKLEPLGNKYIGGFIKDNVELLRLDKFEENIEEKKIPEKIKKNYNIRILDLGKPDTIQDYDMEQLIEMVQDIYDKQDEIIDYLKIKENK